MGRLRVLSGRDVCGLLAEHGFVLVRQRGSHLMMRKAEAGSTVTVPVPDHEEISRGTLMSVIRQSGLPRHLFE